MQANSTNSILLADIFDSLPESVYSKNTEGVYIACSRRAAQMSGFNSPQEVIGKTDNDLFWAEYASILRANDLRVMESRETLVFEERGHTIDPSILMVRTIKSPLYDAQGQVAGIVGISIDLTDTLEKSPEFMNKLAADKAMQRVESNFLKQWYQEVSGQILSDDLSLDDIGNKLKTYLEGIIDKLPANIYWMDLNGIILGCNQQMATVVGYQNRNDIIGIDSNKFYVQYEAEPCIQNNQDALRNGEVLVFEESAMFNGEEKIFLSHKSALRDSNGEAISLVGVSFDITERKRIERELKIAKNEAEAANLAKMRFMNNMRHDLRTPLSCIVGSARVLKALETDTEKSEFIEGILKSSQNLLQMLTNMLEFDHIQATERTIEFTPVRITQLAQELVEMLQITAKNKGVILSLQVESGIPEVLHSDSYRLQRVLLNLTSNAIKFTHQGSVSLGIGFKENEWHISVKDTGIGIPLEHRHKIFDQFVRLVNSDKGLYEGEGLGLAIVKQFVDELKGRVELSSEVGLGSIFTVVLPNQGCMYEGIIS